MSVPRKTGDKAIHEVRVDPDECDCNVALCLHRGLFRTASKMFDQYEKANAAGDKTGAKSKKKSSSSGGAATSSSSLCTCCTCVKMPLDERGLWIGMYFTLVENLVETHVDEDFCDGCDYLPVVNYLQEILKESSKAAEKTYLTLEEFRAPKDPCGIDGILRHSKYPEDEESRSGKSFLPMLLMRRCNLELKKESPDYDLILRDLSLIESRDWIRFIPMRDHHVLYYLKTLCQMKLRLFGDAKESHDAALEALDEDHYYYQHADDVVDKKKKKLSAGLKVIEQNGSCNQIAPDTPRVTPILTKVNPTNPSLSESVHIEFSGGDDDDEDDSDGGRYRLTARQRILPGEVMAVEAPFFSSRDVKAKCSSLAFSWVERQSLRCRAKEVCHACLGQTLGFSLPCSDCSVVVFCSVECKDAALSGFHKYECAMGLAHMINHSLFLIYGYMTIRYMLSLSPEEFRQMVSSPKSAGASGDHDHVPPQLRCLFDGAVDLDAVREHTAHAVSHLVWELIQRARSADLPNSDTPLQQPPCLLKLMRMFLQFQREYRVVQKPFLPCGDFQAPPPGCLPLPDMMRVFTHGLSIYPTLSLLSHSCMANAAYFDVGGKTILFATRAIDKGEEITVSYIKTCFQMEHDVRSNTLERMFGVIFCDCEACCEGWGPDEFRLDKMTRLRRGLAKSIEMKGLHDQTVREISCKDGDAMLKEMVRESMYKRTKLTSDTYAIWGCMFAEKIVYAMMLKYHHKGVKSPHK